MVAVCLHEWKVWSEARTYDANRHRKARMCGVWVQVFLEARPVLVGMGFVDSLL